MSVMCEIAYSDKDVVPELSYGSHFFQDLVETGIFYVALFDNKDNVVFNEFSNFPNAFVGQETVNDSYLRQR